MSLRSSFHIKASMVLTRADHLFIYNNIILLFDIILLPNLWVRRITKPASYVLCPCVSDALAIQSVIHIYIYQLPVWLSG